MRFICIFIYLQEKLKALKYIHNNKEKSAIPVSIFEQPVNRDSLMMNDLHIKIIKGINLQSKQKGKVCLDVYTSFYIIKFWQIFPYMILCQAKRVLLQNMYTY